MQTTYLSRPFRQFPYILDSYMIYTSDEGFDLQSFLTQGALLLRPGDLRQLHGSLDVVHEKIDEIAILLPRLGRQLEFLSHYYEFHIENCLCESGPLQQTAFALIYACKETDLIPDTIPGGDYLDDAAITELVLQNYEQHFKLFCDLQRLAWSEIAPEH